MRGANLASAIGFTAVAWLLWLMCAGVRASVRSLPRGTAAAAIVLACALVPPLIEPTNLSVGTLLAFLIAAAAGVVALIILAARLVEILLERTPQSNRPSAPSKTLA
jgi:hypothetical protein